MHLSQPYLFTSPRMVALVDRAHMAPNEGVIADSIYGYHTLWAAEMPFIPAHVGRNDRDFDTEATNRISRAVQRQIRFLYDLAQSRDHLATFELRFVSWPHSSGFARVGIAFIAKTFHPNERMSRQLALELWNKFNAVFPREVPFSYPLVPVCEPDQASKLQTHTFEQWYQPIPFDTLTQFGSLVELRKYEDWPTLRNIGGVYQAHDYIPHPFVAALDYSAMARLFETMAHQQKTCVVAITIRPQPLTDQEELILHEHAGWFERITKGTYDQNNSLVKAMHELQNDVFDAYPRAYAEQGLRVFNVLKRESHSLFTVRLQIVGEPFASSELVEALGSEVMANAGNAYPSLWSRMEAGDENEFRWALFNLQWLEFARWGISPRIQQVPALARLRQLATVMEVSGAFRLPVAPGSGSLAGLDVRDEPFLLVAPPASSNGHAAQIPLGNILDRGVPTGISCSLPISTFSGFTSIFGENGPAREIALREILQGLSTFNIPWIFIGGNEATSHSTLAHRTGVRHVLIDASLPTCGLEFHPLLPPPGVALSKFLDALVRIFTSIDALDVASSSLLRRALIQTYERAGWTEQRVGEAIDLTEIATQIEAVLQHTSIPVASANLLRTQCLLPLQEVALILPHVCTAPYVQENPWKTPTVITFGWLGSDSAAQLVRGSLWVWLTLAQATAGVTTHALRGIIAMEEVHLFFRSPGDRTSTCLAAPLAKELAHAGVGMIFVDDCPDVIDASVSTQTQLSIITANSNRTAQEHAASLLGASPRQHVRMQNLASTEAVVGIRGSAPVLIELAG